MTHIRLMGYSVTPKMHGMETHIVTQMRSIAGRIGKLMEHWNEQYHQTGFRFDLAYCCAGSLIGQTAIWSICEKRSRNPLVQLNKQLLEKAFVGRIKKKRAAIKSEEKKMHIKLERREHALAEILATIELDRKEAILAKLNVEEDMEDIDELEDLESKLLGSMEILKGLSPYLLTRDPRILCVTTRHLLSS